MTDKMAEGVFVLRALTQMERVVQIAKYSVRRQAVMGDSPSFQRQADGHISDHDLERYYLGMIKDEKDLTVLEEHLLICPECVARAVASDAYIDQIRAGVIIKGFDLP